MTSTAVTARPCLATVAASDANNVWIAYNGPEFLGRIYKDFSGNFYYELGRSISQRFGSKQDALFSLYETTERANQQHQKQISSELESITENWGHVAVPGSANARRIPNVGCKRPKVLTHAKPSTQTKPSHTQTVIIGRTECVKTKHGLIAID
ncbi:hypothetical protein [Acaryochloris marina]|uniref:Uncharacterized protein n=1 Tax=Acaryochloris marina (strain MBIC 11017) TaxID=329726 RepID=B0C7L7_ACAM1|nr:hypothetical protein [Acaryochloris marina]ABW25277.1 hypothetical protein AM1_0191 [Acaryochloris marina MBIC11017]